MYLGIQIFLVNTEKVWKGREHFFFPQWSSNSGDLGHFPSKALSASHRQISSCTVALSGSASLLGRAWRRVPPHARFWSLRRAAENSPGLRRDPEWMCSVLGVGQSCVVVRCPSMNRNTVRASSHGKAKPAARRRCAFCWSSLYALLCLVRPASISIWLLYPSCSLLD